MKLNHNQKGFATLELVLLAVVVTLIVFAGYKVVNNKKAAQTASTPNGGVAQTVVPAKFTSKDDTKTASNALDQTPIDKQLDPGQLDSSIKSLL
jgi:hypothetical protein